MIETDICVIGAGPAGLSPLVFIGNRDAVIFEEHRQPGIPKHCSGLIGIETLRLMRSYVGDITDASYNTILFHAFNRVYEVSYRDKFVFHINRPLLEEKLASLVEGKGHRILYASTAKPVGINTISIGSVEYQCNMILVAEGASGRFRRFFINPYPGFIVGIQYLSRIENVDVDTIYISYSEFTPGFFSWIIPLDKDTAIIGGGFDEPRVEIIEKALNRIATIYGVKPGGVNEKFGGIIPRDKPLLDPVYAGRVVFHGDSVPLTKPYTGGGLHYIFKLSKHLGEAIDNNSLSSYRRIYHSAVHKLLLEHQALSILRKISMGIPVPFITGLNKMGFFTPSDYDKHYALIFKTIPLVLGGLFHFLASPLRDHWIHRNHKQVFPT